MYYLTLIWSLLPIPIGIGCLIFAWGILYRRKDDNTENDGSLDKYVDTDKKLEKLFSQNPEHNLHEEKDLPKSRKSYYVIIFTGLGIGSILLGLTTFFPHLMLAAKGAFLFTLFISFAMHSINEQKAPDKQLENNDQSDIDKSD